MNRRVLLIDGDSAFRETLSRQLGRYRVVVMTEADPERALALAASDPPDLLVIAVEEPEKQGFKTFQKARKALPAKLPIVLVTNSLPPESFTKHRGMKSHADEYLDKRDLSEAELIGKLDNLVGLGEPDPEDEIPVAEDIPMEIADGDVVLDEQVDDDDVGSFAQDGGKHDMATINPNSEVLVDRMVAQETDAAFDALLGDDMFGGGDPVAPEPAATMVDPGHDGASPIDVDAPAALDVPVEEVAPEPIDAAPEPVEAAAPEPIEAAPVAVEDVDSGIPEPVPHKIPDEASAAAPVAVADAESVPAPIRDGGRETGDDFDSYSKMAAKQTPDDAHADPVEAHAPLEVPSSHDDDFQDEEAPASRDSLSAIPIVDDDLISLDEEAVEVEEEAPAPAPAPPAPEPAPVAAAPTRKSSPTAAPPIPERKSKPTVVPEPEPVAAVPQPVAAVAEKKSGPTPVAAEKKSGPNPTVDLGLDSIAQNVEAEREQSGVYDHKGLRKIGELERQIAQLKTELERARSTADAAAKGSREAQFLNLREGNLAKEKELKEAKKALEQQAKELAEATERLKHAQHAKEKLEAVNAKLEAQIFESREKELEEQLTAVTAKLGELERDAETKGKLVVKAEAAIAQLEQDLATERAHRAAGASEAEQRLHAEREQMLQRHKSELAAQQAEAASAQEAALTRLREELEGAAAANLDQTIEELRRANAQEHTEAVEALEKKHSDEVVNLKAEQAGEVARVKNELGGRIAELQSALADANSSHVAALAGAHDATARAAAELEAQYKAQLDEAAQSAAAAAAAHKAELAQAHQAAAAAEAAHAAALEQLKATYEAEIAAREEELEEARERDAESHGQAIAQLKSTLDRATAAHEVKLAAAQREVQELMGQHEAAKEQIAAQHEAALAELRAKHEADMGSISDGAKRTQETHRAALAEQQQKYEAELAALNESAQREVAESRAQVNAARKAAEDASARATAEREELLQAHASQIAELEAKHERALAVANGEALKAKAIADTEHGKEIAALKAEADRKLRELEEAHARLVSDMTGERDELKKGLSGARDQLKRTDAELASAVQTIADRNADLRAHAAAIAERDQRITELRGEIESLEAENANYQEQVLRAYQKIKSDEAMVARARKAMAIALTVLDDQGNPTTTKSES